MERPFFLTSQAGLKEVGMRIGSVVHQLDDRVPDYLQRFIQRRAGKRQDLVSFLKLPVVAVTANYWINYPAADSWIGIRGIVDERRWTGGRGRLGVTKLTIGLKVEHALVGCRWPFQVQGPIVRPTSTPRPCNRSYCSII
jgi:hypothetical protein